jgi:hypothetical protein
MENQAIRNRYIKLDTLVELLQRLFPSKFGVDVGLPHFLLACLLFQLIMLLYRREQVIITLWPHGN